MTELRTPNSVAPCPNSELAIVEMKRGKFTPSIPMMKIMRKSRRRSGRAST
jgi:hypothetical protein